MTTAGYTPPRCLHIDIETYSDEDIKTAGLYRYCQSERFEILLFAYAFNGDPVAVVDLANGEELPQEVREALSSPDVLKVAYNAAFEYNCIEREYDVGGLDAWRCTMIASLYAGLPASLGDCGAALGFSEDKKKLTVGRTLIQYFCKPCKPTRTNGGRERNLPQHDAERWEIFKEYCRRDVETERWIGEELEAYPVPDDVWREWVTDQQIQRTGALIDRSLVEGALAIDAAAKAELMERAQALTGLDNPNSLAQLRVWLEGMGFDLDNLTKQTVNDLLAQDDLDAKVREVLEIRQELGKTSVKKYEAMENCAGSDGRVRGLIQFYGAGRTGRYAGRLVQVQNLPRNYLNTLDSARTMVINRNAEALRLIYGNVADVLSQLIRTAFIPREGYEFAVADYSAIEARVISWIAGEEWRLEVFRTTGKIYETSAANMFGVPIETIAKGRENYALRAKGKIAELALGYGGGVNAMIAMGAERMGVPEEELADIVNKWRMVNPRIKDLWHKVEQAAQDAVLYGREGWLPRGIHVSARREALQIRLPSGRVLNYRNPEARPDPRGRIRLSYMAQSQTSRKWERTETWGGKLVENIVQAVARDLLAAALNNLTAAGYIVNFHIHDEVVAEIPIGGPLSLEDMIAKMCDAPAWAEGLPLNADGFVGNYYKKE